MATPEQPAAKHRKLNLTEEATVLVGTEPTRFTVPKHFLTKSSDFFKACCNGNWCEASDKEVKLPDVEAQNFEVTYNKSLEERNAIAEKLVMPLLRLGVLGDLLGDAIFRNAVNDGILSACDSTKLIPSAKDIHRTYSLLPAGSTLKRLLLDMQMTAHAPSDFEKWRKYVGADFVFDVMVALKKDRDSVLQTPPPTYANRCDYHEHDKGAPRCA